MIGCGARMVDIAVIRFDLRIIHQGVCNDHL